ncbi:MAG: 50S ribosomal protein L6 [Pseudomonadota bacterium]|jgi:large subunit ribosomal protein L6|nr:50S ribosomal protein L6 [Pseudomonadota bacterium]QKK05384.1 MAG: 50S ribosomal protein L6 [Pseudomonadota bacterium]|tara:strand:+ start:385 stop:918 length:534 start_codon:yes stop_codon:yes gene_type:complete
MSRIAKNPVTVPEGVDVQISGQDVTVKGKLGELKLRLVDELSVKLEDGLVSLTPRSQSRFARSIWGTSRSLIANMVEGVSNGFSKKLEIKGVGYRASVQGSNVVLQLGYSHDVIYPIPAGIKINAPNQTELEISGIDKKQVGQVAAEIIAFRPPEPYKGKGIRHEGQRVLRKEGKKK